MFNIYTSIFLEKNSLFQNMIFKNELPLIKINNTIKNNFIQKTTVSIIF